MEDHLLHDPRTKMQIKEILFEFLYGSVNEKFTKRLDNIIVQNTVLGGYSHSSFVYKGIFYAYDKTPPPRKMNRLMLQMQATMNDYLKELDELNSKELPYVVGFINQVLNSSNELHDYLRLFPASVHRPVQSLIDTCPCRNKKLSEESVLDIQDKNKNAIHMMKKRMVINLIT